MDIKSREFLPNPGRALQYARHVVSPNFIRHGASPKLLSHPAAAASLRHKFAGLRLNQMFDWNDLRYFLAVAREGSTIGAATPRKVTQSTVQRRRAALEEAIASQLVERTPTGY